MSSTESLVVQLFLLFAVAVSGAFGYLMGIDAGRKRERARIRSRIVTDQATGAADYCEAEDYADRMVRL